MDGEEGVWIGKYLGGWDSGSLDRWMDGWVGEKT